MTVRVQELVVADHRVQVHYEDGGYWVEVEDLPGCFASANSLDELVEATAEAIAIYLAV